MKLRAHYDWVVLGEHPGALLTAALVARLGLSVLIVPLGARPGIHIGQSGQILDFESNLLIGLGESGELSGLLRGCLQHLGVLPAEKDAIQQERAFPLVLTPSFRFQSGMNIELAEREWTRNVTSSDPDFAHVWTALKLIRPELIKYWNRLPQRLTLVDKKAAGADSERKITLASVMKRSVATAQSDVDAWVGDEPVARRAAYTPGPQGRMREFLDALSVSFGGSLSGERTLSEQWSLWALAQTSASVHGGMSAYRKLLKRCALGFGAHILDDSEVRRIFIDSGKLSGLQLASRAEVVRADGGALGVSAQRVRPLIEVSGRRWPSRFSEGSTPSGWNLTLALSVHADALPARLPGRVVWYEEGGLPFEMEVALPSEFAQTDTKRRHVFLRVTMPYDEKTLDPAYQRLICARMFRKFTEIIPFVEQHLHGVYPDFRSSDLREFRQVYPAQTLAALSDHVLVFAPMQSEARPQGRGSRSGVEGLFLVSGESYPHMGSLGPTVAALESAAWIAHRAGVAGPFG